MAVMPYFGAAAEQELLVQPLRWGARGRLGYRRSS